MRDIVARACAVGGGCTARRRGRGRGGRALRARTGRPTYDTVGDGLPSENVAGDAVAREVPGDRSDRVRPFAPRDAPTRRSTACCSCSRGNWATSVAVAHPALCADARARGSVRRQAGDVGAGAAGMPESPAVLRAIATRARGGGAATRPTSIGATTVAWRTDSARAARHAAHRPDPRSAAPRLGCRPGIDVGLLARRDARAAADHGGRRSRGSIRTRTRCARCASAARSCAPILEHSARYFVVDLRPRRAARRDRPAHPRLQLRHGRGRRLRDRPLAPVGQRITGLRVRGQPVTPTGQLHARAEQLSGRRRRRLHHAAAARRWCSNRRRRSARCSIDEVRDAARWTADWSRTTGASSRRPLRWRRVAARPSRATPPRRTALRVIAHQRFPRRVRAAPRRRPRATVGGAAELGGGDRAARRPSVRRRCMPVVLRRRRRVPGHAGVEPRLRPARWCRSSTRSGSRRRARQPRVRLGAGHAARADAASCVYADPRRQRDLRRRTRRAMDPPTTRSSCVDGASKVGVDRHRDPETPTTTHAEATWPTCASSTRRR